MELLIDSSLWIDFAMPKSPPALKQQIAVWIHNERAATCAPVRYEVLRGALRHERPRLEQQLRTTLWLPLPDGFWEKATQLGQKCRDAGFTVGAFDLMIAAVALHHDAEVVTFDSDYALIAQAEPRLRVNALVRIA